MDDEGATRRRGFVDVNAAAALTLLLLALTGVIAPVLVAAAAAPAAAAAAPAAALLPLRLLPRRLAQHVEPFLFVRQMLRR